MVYNYYKLFTYKPKAYFVTAGSDLARFNYQLLFLRHCPIARLTYACLSPAQVKMERTLNKLSLVRPSGFYRMVWHDLIMRLFLLQTGHTALQRAAAEGHVEIVRSLLENGVSVDHQDEVVSIEPFCITSMISKYMPISKIKI